MEPELPGKTGVPNHTHIGRLEPVLHPERSHATEPKLAEDEPVALPGDDIPPLFPIDAEEPIPLAGPYVEEEPPSPELAAAPETPNFAEDWAPAIVEDDAPGVPAAIELSTARPQDESPATGSVHIGTSAEGSINLEELWEAEKKSEPASPLSIAIHASDSPTGTEDVDVLKRYISLKEGEARDLKEQQRQSVVMIKRLSRQLESVVRKSRDTLTLLESERQRNESLKKEIHDQNERHLQELGIVRSDLEGKIRKAGHVEVEAKELESKREEWKAKIREELKRIKLKERELENKYELLKRDTQALLDSKDKHVLELKNKADALELNIETFESKLREANTSLASVDGKKRRLIETLKLAIALLEQIDRNDDKG